MIEQKLAHAQKAELFALKLSIAGTLFMAILGFSFAVLTHSEAIMLDGVFSLISLVMSILTLMIARLVVSPDTKKFQFGFAHFEPLWNTFKSLVVLIICVFAFVGAIGDLMQGGRTLKFGLASIYALLATLGCLIIAWVMNQYKNKSYSTLVAVDAKGWLIDTIISSALLVGFVVVFFIQETQWAIYLPYVDPALVAVLVLISLPIPIKLLKENMREVLLLAPNEDVQEEICKRLKAAIESYDITDARVRLTKMGRYIILNAYVIVPNSFQVTRINELDEIREKIKVELLQYYPQIIFDIIFTENREWSE